MAKPKVKVPGKVKRRIKWHRDRLRRGAHHRHGNSYPKHGGRGNWRSNMRARI